MRFRARLAAGGRAVAPFLLSLLLGASAAAQDLLPAGDWRLEGKDHKGRPVLVVLNIERAADGLSLERTGSRVESEDGLKRPEVWSSTEVERLENGRVRVTYAPRKRGIAGRLMDLDDDEDPVEATYYLSEGGTRLYEWIEDEDGDVSWAKGGRELPALELVREASFSDLLDDDLKAYEASGVITVGDAFYVAFDNSTKIAIVDSDLRKADLEKTEGRGASNFEGLTRDRLTGRFYAMVEYEAHRNRWAARVWELDPDLDVESDTRLRRFYLPGNNKGFEGVAHVRREGEEFLLALNEGNHGRADRSSRERGHGLIEVFRRRDDGKWTHHTTINVPTTAMFSDYSGLDVRGDRVALVSQTSSLLWVGQLSDDDWLIEGEGEVYCFPRVRSRVRYPTIEGVSWIDERTLVAVSDKNESDEAATEAIHVFRLPE